MGWSPLCMARKTFSQQQNRPFSLRSGSTWWKNLDFGTWFLVQIRGGWGNNLVGKKGKIFEEILKWKNNHKIDGFNQFPEDFWGLWGFIMLEFGGILWVWKYTWHNLPLEPWLMTSKAVTKNAKPWQLLACPLAFNGLELLPLPIFSSFPSSVFFFPWNALLLVPRLVGLYMFVPGV